MQNYENINNVQNSPQKYSIEDVKSQIKLVNNFTKREFTEDEIYLFSVSLCDNDLDRDFEAFSDNALESLSEFFVGKPGITDHKLRADNQIARIYYTSVETVDSRKTYFNTIYKRLVARAYLPKSEENKNFILQLDSGIKKEVSINCGVKECTCSICKNKLRFCNHKKGLNYNNLLCYGIFETIVDAYEWSFVVIPSQKDAGVIKSLSFAKNETKNNEIYNKINKNVKNNGVLLKNYIFTKKITNYTKLDIKCPTKPQLFNLNLHTKEIQNSSFKI